MILLLLLLLLWFMVYWRFISLNMLLIYGDSQTTILFSLFPLSAFLFPLSTMQEDQPNCCNGGDVDVDVDVHVDGDDVGDDRDRINFPFVLLI